MNVRVVVKVINHHCQGHIESCEDTESQGEGIQKHCEGYTWLFRSRNVMVSIQKSL